MIIKARDYSASPSSQKSEIEVQTKLSIEEMLERPEGEEAQMENSSHVSASGAKTPTPQPVQPLERPWQEKGYIFSDVELIVAYAKHTEQTVSDDVTQGKSGAGAAMAALQPKMDIAKFHSLINEFENMINFDKIFSFLKIHKGNIESEYYSALDSFNNNYEGYLKFVKDCKIKDNPWKVGYMRRLESMRDTFTLDDGVLNQQMGRLADNMAALSLDPLPMDRLHSHVMLRCLYSHKLLILDLLESDYEQRINCVHPSEYIE